MIRLLELLGLLIVFGTVGTLIARRGARTGAGAAGVPDYRTSSMPEDPECPTCGGSGKAKQTANAAFGAGSVVLPAVCPTCRGSGHVRPNAAA